MMLKKYLFDVMENVFHGILHIQYIPVPTSGLIFYCAHPNIIVVTVFSGGGGGGLLMDDLGTRVCSQKLGTGVLFLVR